MNRPGIDHGLRHISLFVEDLPGCEDFYTRIMGMEVIGRPDPTNVMLSFGKDNLTLHQANRDHDIDHKHQRLDHLGFYVHDIQSVDDWYLYLMEFRVRMRTEPKTTKGGMRTFYFYDPDGTVLQISYSPEIQSLGMLEGIS